MSRYVLDASAVLALLNQEPGHELVEAALSDSIMSAVNVSEVLSKLIDAGLTLDEAAESFDLLGIEVVDFDKSMAERSASLRSATRKKGLSLGDRCCLALGVETGLEVMTAEREWQKLRICSILLIR